MAAVAATGAAASAACSLAQPGRNCAEHEGEAVPYPVRVHIDLLYEIYIVGSQRMLSMHGRGGDFRFQPRTVRLNNCLKDILLKAGGRPTRDMRNGNRAAAGATSLHGLPLKTRALLGSLMARGLVPGMPGSSG